MIGPWPGMVALLGAVLFVGLPPAEAQDDKLAHSDRFWVTGGLGVGSEDFAGAAGFSYQRGAHLFSLRLASTAGIFDDGFSDVALLYGRATRATDTRRYRLGAAAGIAAVDGCVEEGPGSFFGNCEDRPTVVGFPLEAHVTWLPATSFGIGLYGFADLNRTRSFAGVTLSIQLGKLR
jgi:hypothetical protein